MEKVGAVDLRSMLAELPCILDGQYEEASYRILAQGIRSLVLSGRLLIGSSLPSERALAEALKVSRKTTSSAYCQLRKMGFIDTSPGKRACVRLSDQYSSAMLRERFGDEGFVIDLASGSPMPEAELFETFYRRAVELLPAFLRRANLPIAGLTELRRLVAHRFNERGLPTTVDQILITPGALNAIQRAFGFITRRGDTVLFDLPTYPQAVRYVSRIGRVPYGYPLGSKSGRVWVADLLEEAHRNSKPSCYYIIPDGHNPTGAVMSDEQRDALASLSVRYETQLIIDETTTELTRRPSDLHLPLAAHLSSGEAVTIGSLSKLFWPGLRVGWVRASPGTIAALAEAQGNVGTCSVLDQLTAIQVFENLEEVKALRWRQLDGSQAAAIDALSRYWPDARCKPGQGFTLWVQLPKPLAAALSMDGESTAGVRLSPGSQFGFGEHQFPAHLRIPLVQPPRTISEGIRRIAAVYSALNEKV